VNEPDTGHDYDGIRELDNRLPNWWLATLFGAMAFALLYWGFYHLLGAPGLDEKFRVAEAEQARKAAANAPVSDKLLVALAHDDKTMAQAKQIFTQTCAACHGMNGEGKIGPNLTDDAWLHGGEPTAIYKTISGGVAQKGMPAWEPVLGQEKIRWLAAYVETLKGKNLPGKAPEGQRL
jgi:cytochrome c oxidase cbb3-type subunit 3